MRIPQLRKNSLPFIEFGGSLLHKNNPGIELHPKPDKSNPHIHTISFRNITKVRKISSLRLTYETDIKQKTEYQEGREHF
jgi:hypothetical protein